MSGEKIDERAAGSTPVTRGDETKVPFPGVAGFTTMDIDSINPKHIPELRLRKALFDVEQYMERFLLSNSFLLLHDTAKAVHDDVDLYGDRITIGIKYKYITHEVISNFKSFFKGVEITREGFMYEYREVPSSVPVPVYIQFIHREYHFFKRPDRAFYKTGQYWFANPFSDYLLIEHNVV